MLYIQFGETDDAFYGPAWFVNNYEPSWLSDALVGQMLSAVDRTEYRGGELLYSDVLGPISPRDLSGGVKTLISIYKEPSKMFDATSCGANCAKWLLAIGEREDVTVNLNYPMPFDDLEPFAIYIQNTDAIVETARDYALTAIDVLHKERFDER